MTNTLARDGGPKTRQTPYPTWPVFGDEEAEASARVIRSGKVNYWSGQEGKAFEKEFGASVDCEFAIALANGSVALELALRALDIGPGDEVIVTPRSFIASASCVPLVGAKPVFADIDRETQNITAETISAVLTPRTKAIIPVHLCGWPCDMDPIMDLAKEHNLKVIEDCAQAHGARYKDRPVGSLGHVAAWSFCQDKIMSTGGEGGMLTTNDSDIWDKAWSYKDHGKSFDTVFNKQHPPGFRWLHESFGTNWRMTEMQSAIGRVLLKKLPQLVETRRRNARLLNEHLSQYECLRLTIPSDDIYHSYYRYHAFVRPEKLPSGWDRDYIMNSISAEGVPCLSGSCSEIYLEKAFSDSPHVPAVLLPNAKELGETSLFFPVHPTISEDDLRHTLQAVDKLMETSSLEWKLAVG